jgi:hypothetical protein
MKHDQDYITVNAPLPALDLDSVRDALIRGVVEIKKPDSLSK